MTGLTPERIKPASEIGTALDPDCLLGLGTIDQRMLILVGIDKLMFGDGMSLVEKIAV